MGNPAKRLKRAKEKAKETRRRWGTSPWALLGKSSGECAAYINGNWREQGMMTLWVFRPGLAGGWASATFLIDLDCLGLKDAFTRMDCAKSAALDSMNDVGGAIRIELDEVRRWVAAAIRWSREHQFLLPKKYEKAVTFLGGVGDWREADVSGFARGGKMRYIGSMEDLESRLIGRSADEFLERENVEFLLDEGGDSWEFDESPEDFGEKEIDPRMAEIMERFNDLAERARIWLLARGAEPHAMLPLVVPILALAFIDSGEAEKDEAMEAFNESLRQSAEGCPEFPKDEILTAVSQLLDFLESTKPPEFLATIERVAFLAKDVEAEQE